MPTSIFLLLLRGLSSSILLVGASTEEEIHNFMEHCWQQSFSSHFFSSSKKIVIYNDDDKGKERGHSTTTLPYWRPQPLCLLSSLFTVLKTGLYVLHVHTVVVGVVLLHNILYICVAGERKRGRCHKHCPSG